MASGIKVLVDPVQQGAATGNENADVIDIVAVHGIGADPDNTWTGRGSDEEKINWLTHFSMLPKAMPTARIMRFGYQSGWYGTAQKEPKKTHVFDVAEMLLKQLELHRRGTIRPIIFIAHSYGGLVLMQALRRSFENPDKWSNPFRYTAGLLFFGTPFRGRRGLSLAEIVDVVVQSNPELQIYPETMALSIEENPYLQHIVNRYTETRLGDHPTPLCCFYETKPSPISKTLQNNKLKDGYLIPEESACLDLSKGVERHPLERHHYNLQKFPGPSDFGYRAVEDAIVRLAKGAREYLRKCSVGSKTGCFLVPFGRNETFVDRSVILDDLLERLPPAAHPHDCQRTALEGLGGIGKTQIALEAAYRIHVTYPDCSVFWVPVIDSTSFYKAYRDIGQALGLKGLDDAKADLRVLVHAALAQDDVGPWLLILDNADDQELLFGKEPVLKDLPFNRSGSILVTTRNHEVAVMLDVSKPGLLKVEAMQRHESSKLLCQGLKDSQIRDITSIENLLDFLADLPLAIKQASAYMAKTGISTTRYLAHCQSSNKAMIKLLGKDFSDCGRYSTAQNPVITTWLISFRHIMRDAPLAADYLRFISFLSEKNIPKLLLPVGDDELEADEAFGTLLAYAFANERIDTGWFDIHRLVQLAMRNWMTENGEQVSWRIRVIKQLDKIYLLPKHENRELWIGYLPHAKAALKTYAEVTDEITESHLLSKVGESSSLLGEFSEAEMMHRNALELYTKVLGDEHPDTLKSMSSLASTLEGLGHYNDAEAILRKALELDTQVLGIEHPDTLNSMSILADVLYGQGQYVEAETINRKTLELRTKVLGTEHPDTLMSMNNLAYILDWQSRFAEAEAIHRKALQLRTKVLGTEHPDIAMSMNNLALSLDGLGQYVEAEAILYQALELFTKVLGAEHPDTLMSMSNLAYTFNLQGQYAKAALLHRETLNLRTKVQGARHPDTLTSLNNLAFSLNGQGRYSEAETIYRKTYELDTEISGPEHPNTLTSWTNLVRTLEGQGQYAEAEVQYRKILELKTKVFGAENPSTFKSMSHLARILKVQGQHAEAEALYRKTLELRTKVLGAEHPDTLSSMALLADMLQIHED